MAEVFEDICKQYLWMENVAGRLPFHFREAGRWWGNNPVRKCEQEIDIIAFDDSRAIFCECKWTGAPVGFSVLEGLMEKSGMFGYAEAFFFVFSKSGFTKSCREQAPGNARLVGFDDMALGMRS
jgi:hypothetical protein